jgi:hypothetical protein
MLVVMAGNGCGALSPSSPVAAWQMLPNASNPSDGTEKTPGATATCSNRENAATIATGRATIRHLGVLVRMPGRYTSSDRECQGPAGLVSAVP